VDFEVWSELMRRWSDAKPFSNFGVCTFVTDETLLENYHKTILNTKEGQIKCLSKKNKTFKGNVIIFIHTESLKGHCPVNKKFANNIGVHCAVTIF
jgi:hypothetical protein